MHLIIVSTILALQRAVSWSLSVREDGMKTGDDATLYILGNQSEASM